MNPHLKINDEIQVKIRARILEIGPEMALIDLIELYQQGRIDKPLQMYVPINAIKSDSVPRGRLPSEIPI